MKNLIFYIITILTITNLYSCKIEKKIIGKWNFENIETTKKFSEENKKKYKKQLLAIIKNSYLKFQPDKTYEIKFNNKKANGFWNYEKQKNIITTKIKGSKKIDVSELVKINSKELVIKVNKKDETITFYLIKTKDKNDNLNKTDI